ncbi:unnamed protein product [Prorocentrum cordatum]|uniref:Uncharacterized protein n=1 Tax=Prorocentrum cordatum TaxID=2364126 RepID=A0ABN9PX74_9DINO|nr:unnamed protein product [Polarella glacialis]
MSSPCDGTTWELLEHGALEQLLDDHLVEHRGALERVAEEHWREVAELKAQLFRLEREGSRCTAAGGASPAPPRAEAQARVVGGAPSRKHCWPPLHAAAGDGQLQVVRHLCEQVAAAVDTPDTKHGFTPLRVAAHNGQLEVVRYLWEQAKAFDLVRTVLLHFESASEASNFLTQYEADGYAVSGNVLGGCVCVLRGPDESVLLANLRLSEDASRVDLGLELDALLEFGIHQHAGPFRETAADTRGHCGDIGELSRELDGPRPGHNIGFSVFEDSRLSYKECQVLLAGELDLDFVGASVAALKEDLKRLQAKIAAGAPDGWTRLHAAARAGQLEVVLRMCEHARVAAHAPRSKNGWTPLRTAARAGQLEVARYLCECAEVAADIFTVHDGGTPLYIAALSGYLGIVRYLCEQGTVAADAPGTEDGGTLLHAAAHFGQLEVVRCLCGQGKVATDAPNTKYGGTPLHSAACAGQLEVAQCLCERAEVSPDSANAQGSGTPFHIAALGGKLEVLAASRGSRRPRRATPMARGPGRIIDALFGNGTMDRMLASVTGEPKRLPPPAGPPRPPDEGDSDRLEQSIRKQEQQTLAIEKMMAELQMLMVSKVEEEKKINTDLRQDMDDLKLQISTVQESYSNACDQLEMTQVELQSRVNTVTAELTQERVMADERAMTAAERSKELEEQVRKIEEERKRLYDQRSVITGEVKSLTEKVVSGQAEKAQLQEKAAATETEKAELERNIAEVYADKAQLGQELSAASERGRELQQAAAEAEAQTALLLEQRKVITGEVANLTQKVVNTENDKAMLNQEIAELESQNADLGGGPARTASQETRVSAKRGAVERSPREDATQYDGDTKRAQDDSPRPFGGAVTRNVCEAATQWENQAQTKVPAESSMETDAQPDALEEPAAHGTGGPAIGDSSFTTTGSPASPNPAAEQPAWWQMLQTLQACSVEVSADRSADAHGWHVRAWGGQGAPRWTRAVGASARSAAARRAGPAFRGPLARPPAGVVVELQEWLDRQVLSTLAGEVQALSAFLAEAEWLVQISMHRFFCSSLAPEARLQVVALLPLSCHPAAGAMARQHSRVGAGTCQLQEDARRGGGGSTISGLEGDRDSLEGRVTASKAEARRLTDRVRRRRLRAAPRFRARAAPPRAMGPAPSKPSRPEFEALLGQLEEGCRDAAEVLRTADVLLLCTGAGFSADSGLAVYKDIAGLRAYEELGLCYHDICRPEWLHSDPELFYGFWGTCYNDYRDTEPHDGYGLVRGWRDRFFASSLAARSIRNRLDGGKRRGKSVGGTEYGGSASSQSSPYKAGCGGARGVFGF